jgi:hypothetical protein
MIWPTPPGGNIGKSPVSPGHPDRPGDRIGSIVLLVSNMAACVTDGALPVDGGMFVNLR